MLTGFKSILLLVITTLFSFTNMNARNLLTNGDFEGGGSTNGFFINQYGLINPVNGVSTPGKYAITKDPKFMDSNFISGGDKTTGNGNMLVINGATSNNQVFWTAGSNGGTFPGLTVGTTYTLSFWIKSVSNEVTSNATQATINAFFVNATYTPSNIQAPLPAVGWQKVSFTFIATQTFALIQLRTTSTSTIGNDFAVDDFELKAGGLPFILVSNSSTNPTCPSINDGTITATASGGSTPYKYTLTGTSSANNSTGKFTGLSEGTYTLTITDNAGASLTPITGIVLAAPNPLIVSATLPTVCPGTPTTLNVSGANGYTWTANPLDPTLTNPNSTSITVSPTKTTTYTVSTGKIPNLTNLINNGDFELGDTDFTSDYITNVNPNPFGIKKAYAIVTNPKSWFNPFSTCPDKTTGLGKMMIADGSDQNGGNDKVWVQNGVSVVPGTDYDFTYYLQNIVTGGPARIEVTINGNKIGPEAIAPSLPCIWQKNTYKWNSGSNTFASIIIYDRETSGNNDFALDDISLVESPVCPLTKSITITVNSTLTLEIIDPAPVCFGGTVDIMQPAITAGSTTGTTLTYWTDAAATIAVPNPSVITTSGTYYIKSTLGSCSIIKPVLVSINSSGGVPTPGVSPVSYCQNSVASALTATPATSATLNWYGIDATGGTSSLTAPIPLTASVGTITYYVSQSIGTCESPRVAIDVTVNLNVTPTFTVIPTTYCENVTAPTLQTSSTNSTAITGAWNPTTIDTSILGKTDYIFTPTTGSCAIATTLIIDVNPNVIPTFTAVPDICIGAILSPLPLSSLEAITGSWTPPLDNTKTTTYTFTPTAGLCAISTTLDIIINTSATIIPQFDTVDPICVGGVLSDLPLISINAIKGTWSPPLNTNTTTSYTFNPDLGQCAATAQLQIEVFDIPIVQANAVSSSICSGSSTSITLSSNVPTTTFNWNAINSNVTGATAGSGDKIIQKISTVGNQSGEVVYALTPSANGCSGLTIIVPITVNPIPEVSASSNFQTICSGGSTTIELSSEVGSTTFDWTVIQTGVLGGLSGNDSTIVQTLTTTDIKEGFANYIVTPKFNNCFGKPLTVVVRVNPIPAIFGTSGGDICSGNYTNIKLIPNPNIPLTTFEWTANPIDVTGAKDDSGEDVIEQLLETVTGGSVTYTVTPSYGGCKGTSSLVKINVDPLPKPNLKDGKICIEKATGNTLNPYLIETNLNNPNFEFEWYFESVRINGATQNSYEAAAIGKYSVLVFNKLTGCTSKEAFATMTETFPASSYTVEKTAAFTENATITITVNGDLNEYLYKIDDGIWQNSNVFSGIASGLHTISITDTEGCTSFSDTVTIINYPKFFTPNGDGFNDTWNVVGLAENAKLSIYDRYGKLVKQISSDGTGWDGTFNNQLLPATDYWFTINYFENKIEKLFKAHFSLKR